MKLSEAIRLGAMMGPQEFGPGLNYGRCALQSAIAAVGEQVTQATLPALRKHWRWMWEGDVIATCADCGRVANAFAIAIHLNDNHRWSRERIADWVATIEPQEVDHSAPVTIREEVFGEGPLRLLPEEVKV